MHRKITKKVKKEIDPMPTNNKILYPGIIISLLMEFDSIIMEPFGNPFLRFSFKTMIKIIEIIHPMIIEKRSSNLSSNIITIYLIRNK